VSGIVVGLSVHNVGAIVQPGEVLLNLVPDSTTMVLHARVSPLDVDLVSAGQSAQVVLSAFRQSEVPPIDATVLRVSADRLEDERTGEPYFEAVIQVYPLGDSSDSGPQLVPGMPAEVYINTGMRSPLQYLLQPLKESFQRALRET
jgi:membrane fusion protein, epimerase transport system